MTFASAAAALVMKTAVPPILARFGFRTTLSVNAVIVGLSFMTYALFYKEMPHWIMYGILLTGGFFRSLQFTALNGLAFADIDQPQMSRASTMSAMGQRLAQSIGIGFAAMLLHFLQVGEHATHVTAAVIDPAFLVIGGVALVSVLFLQRLPADAVAELLQSPCKDTCLAPLPSVNIKAPVHRLDARRNSSFLETLSTRLLMPQPN